MMNSDENHGLESTVHDSWYIYIYIYTYMYIYGDTKSSNSLDCFNTETYGFGIIQFFRNHDVEPT